MFSDYEGEHISALPEKITVSDEATEIGEFAFRNMTNLKEVFIDNTVYKLGDHFIFGCDLDKLTVPGTVQNYYGAFSGCNSLGIIEFTDEMSDGDYGDYYWFTNIKDPPKTVILAEGIKSTGNGLRYCKNIESVVLPRSITRIDNMAFDSCENLSSVNIPDGVISIGDSAFGSCYNLTGITIPDSVSTIGDGAA